MIRETRVTSTQTRIKRIKKIKLDKVVSFVAVVLVFFFLITMHVPNINMLEITFLYEHWLVL